MRSAVILKVITGFLFLTIGMSGDACAVLQSSGPSDETKKSSALVSSDAQFASATETTGAVPAASSGPTMKLTFKSRSRAAAQENPAPSLQARGRASEAASIFKSENPHAVSLEGTSPFVKQVGEVKEGYKRNQVVNYGKARASTGAGTTFTVKEREATS